MSKEMENNKDLINLSDRKRNKKAWLGSVGIHVFIFILLVCTGVLSYTPLKNTDIVEVTSIGGGNEGGGSTAEIHQSEPTLADIGADAILEHSDYAKVKVSYEELKAIEPKEELSEKKVESFNNIKSDNNTKSNQDKGNQGKDNSGSGQQEGKGNADGGTGLDTGSGSNKGAGNDTGVDTNMVYSASGVDTPPGYLYRVKPNYPEDLSEDGVTGTTIINVVLNRSGEIETASISKSSGNRRLDYEALRAAKQFRFSPAKIKNIAVRCSVNLPFKFGIQ